MINTYNTIIDIMIIYMFSILFYNMIPFPLALIMGSLLLGLLIYVHLKLPTKRNVLLLIYIIGLGIYTTCITTNITNNFRDFVRISSVLLLINMCTKDYFVDRIAAAVRRRRKQILWSSRLASIVTLVLLCRQSSYAVEKSWGTNAYYLGLGPTLHVTASCMCLVLIMYLIGVNGFQFKATEMLFLLPPLLAIFQSGARIYLLCAAGIVFCYYTSRIKGKSIKYVLVPLGILIVCYLLATSNIIDKFLFTKQGYAPDKYNALDRFTSGRTYFWLLDLKAFAQSNIIEQLFGHGFYYIKEVSNLSGHNDIIHMLLGAGLLGATIYLSLFISAIKNTMKNKKDSYMKKGTRAAYLASLVLYIFAPMMLNGIFGYQHLLYSIVLMMTFINDINKERKHLYETARVE